MHSRHFFLLSQFIRVIIVKLGLCRLIKGTLYFYSIWKLPIGLQYRCLCFGKLDWRKSVIRTTWSFLTLNTHNATQFQWFTRGCLGYVRVRDQNPSPLVKKILPNSLLVSCASISLALSVSLSKKTVKSLAFNFWRATTGDLKRHCRMCSDNYVVLGVTCIKDVWLGAYLIMI